MLSEVDMFWQAAERWHRDQATVLVQFESLPPRMCLVVDVQKPTVIFSNVAAHEEEFPVDFTGADIRPQGFEKIEQVKIVCVFRASWDDRVDSVPSVSVTGNFIELREVRKPS